MRVYCIFKTAWGWFGLLGENNALIQSVLPNPSRQAARHALLDGQPSARQDPNAFADCRRRIVSYYQGKPVDFQQIPVDLSKLSPFYQDVLRALRGVRYGQTLTYSQLAAQVGRPKAIRAAANAVAANPLPLIIPCHRIIRQDGALGGFSAVGGAAVKEKMLRWEQAI